ncbi:MAG: ABC transporter, partial [Thermoprotei archaeon]
HIMSEVERVCNRIAIINEGRIIEMGYVDELKQKYGVSDLEELFVKVIGSGAITIS